MGSQHCIRKDPCSERSMLRHDGRQWRRKGVAYPSDRGCAFGQRSGQADYRNDDLYALRRTTLYARQWHEQWNVFKQRKASCSSTTYRSNKRPAKLTSDVRPDFTNFNGPLKASRSGQAYSRKHSRARSDNHTVNDRGPVDMSFRMRLRFPPCGRIRLGIRQRTVRSNGTIQ